MKADQTRSTFNPLKHFTRVLMQQGRVQLDADWNEQAAILLHYLQALAADLIGPHGGRDDSFQITQASPPLTGDFVINPGHYYVDGVLCELEATPTTVVSSNEDATKLQISPGLVDDADFAEEQYVEVFPRSSNPSLAKIESVDRLQSILTLSANLGLGAGSMIRRATTYLTQKDLPVPEDITGTKPYLVYLDVWERHMSYLEDARAGRPGIREVALGGPDTATRAKVVWQVKVTDKGPDGGNVPTTPTKDLRKRFESNWSTWEAQWQPPNRGMLKARVEQPPAANDPCLVSPEARYRGAENQLYRVEIHRGGALNSEEGSALPTFKWSRENGAVCFPIFRVTPSDQSTTVTLANLGRDDRFGLAEGDWVEIVDDDYVLQNRAETLLQVHTIDRTTMTVTLTGARTPGSDVGTDPVKHPLLRRWDHQAGDPDENGLTIEGDGAAEIVETSDETNVWLDLEDGIQIQFQAGATYRTGDYWLIPARTAIGDVEWPIEVDDHGRPVVDDHENAVPIALPPHGAQHHYAPLAVIVDPSKMSDPNNIIPLRRTFEKYAT